MPIINKLPNGVTVVMEKITYYRSIAFGFWVKNGSRNEDAELNGISHFIEHMMFKGTKNRTAKQIADEIDAVGGQLNAYTSKEYTCYYTRVLDYSFDTALDVMSDMFFNSCFDNTEIAKERNVIMEEINMYEDTPDELVHDNLLAGVWNGNTLGNPILGTSGSISGITHDSFTKYMRKNYRPDNTVISICGNFDEHEVMDKISKHFGAFEKSEFSDSTDSIFKAPVYHPVITGKVKDIEQIHFAMGFPSLPLGSERSYQLAVLNTIFGGGMSSRLFQKIREENGLSYAVYSYNISHTDTGLFTMYAGLNPLQTEQVLTLMIKEIKRLFEDKITQFQLDSTKEQIKSSYLLSLESSPSIMNAMGRSKLMLDRILSADEIIGRISAVTIKTLYELIEEIFDFNKLSLSAVGKIDGFDFEGMIKSAI